MGPGSRALAVGAPERGRTRPQAAGRARRRHDRRAQAGGRSAGRACAGVRAELKAPSRCLEQLTKGAEQAEQELGRARDLAGLLGKVAGAASGYRAGGARAKAENARSKAAGRWWRPRPRRASARGDRRGPELGALTSAREAHVEFAQTQADLAKSREALEAAEQAERAAIEQLEQADAVNDRALAAREALRTEHTRPPRCADAARRRSLPGVPPDRHHLPSCGNPRPSIARSGGRARRTHAQLPRSKRETATTSRSPPHRDRGSCSVARPSWRSELMAIPTPTRSTG